MRKLSGKKLIDAMMEQTFNGAPNSKLKALAAAYLGVPEEEISNDVMATFRQMEKAIQKADTYAYNSLQDRRFGKPKERHEHSGPGDQPIQIETSKGLDLKKLPLELKKQLLQHIRKNGGR